MEGAAALRAVLRVPAGRRDGWAMLMCCLTLMVVAVMPGLLRGETLLYSSDFSASSGANSIEGWVYVGGVGGGVVRSTTAYDNFFSGGVYGGDGVKGDGALLLNTGDAVAGNEWWTYSLATDALVMGDVLTLSGAAFNGNSSHNSNFTIGLYNVTDDRVLAVSAAMGNSRVGLVDEDNNPFFNFEVMYALLGEDVGDEIVIRVAENLNNAARDVFVDVVSVSYSTGVPEPGRWTLLMLGVMVAGLRRRRP